MVATGVLTGALDHWLQDDGTTGVGEVVATGVLALDHSDQDEWETGTGVVVAAGVLDHSLQDE